MSGWPGTIKEIYLLITTKRIRCYVRLATGWRVQDFPRDTDMYDLMEKLRDTQIWRLWQKGVPPR